MFNPTMPPAKVDHPQDADEIETLLSILDSRTDLFGPEHPETLAAGKQLAIAFWRAGDIDRAIGLLDRVLDYLTASLGPEHPTRVDALGTLGEIMFDQRHLEQAGTILREVLERRVHHAGANDPNSLAAKGNLAAALFNLGREEEAAALEREAFESARMHLGQAHPVTTVLAWNQILMYDRRPDLDSGRGVISELAWLLAEDPSCLDPDQYAIRAMLAERLQWDTPAAC